MHQERDQQFPIDNLRLVERNVGGKIGLVLWWFAQGFTKEYGASNELLAGPALTTRQVDVARIGNVHYSGEFRMGSQNVSVKNGVPIQACVVDCDGNQQSVLINIVEGAN